MWLSKIFKRADKMGDRRIAEMSEDEIIKLLRAAARGETFITSTEIGDITDYLSKMMRPIPAEKVEEMRKMATTCDNKLIIRELPDYHIDRFDFGKFRALTVFASFVTADQKHQPLVFALNDYRNNGGGDWLISRLSDHIEIIEDKEEEKQDERNGID